jgi:hypothetical protein
MWIIDKPRSRHHANRPGALRRRDERRFKSAPSAPAAPDPTAVANAQAAANQATAQNQAALNRTNQVTPYGNLTYTATPGATGGPTDPAQFTATTSLAPAQQQALDQQQTLTNSLYGLANQQTGRIQGAVSQPFDISQAPAMPGSPQQINQQVSDAMYNQAKSRLDPQFQQQEQQMNDTLAAQGLAPGSAAYDQAQANFGRDRNDAYTSAQNAATTAGAAQGAQDYGLALTGRQQGIQEQSFLREQPLNEAIALMGGGQIQNPSFAQTPQTQVAPTDVTGAYGLAQNAKNIAYQGGVQQASSGNAAGAGLAGAALTAAAVF